MISLATTVMDTSVPALLPEWLKNGGSVPTSGSASHHYHCSLVIMGYSRFVIFVIFRFDSIWRIEIKKEHLKLRFVIYVQVSIGSMIILILRKTFCLVNFDSDNLRCPQSMITRKLHETQSVTGDLANHKNKPRNINNLLFYTIFLLDPLSQMSFC